MEYNYSFIYCYLFNTNYPNLVLRINKNIFKNITRDQIDYVHLNVSETHLKKKSEILAGLVIVGRTKPKVHVA